MKLNLMKKFFVMFFLIYPVEVKIYAQQDAQSSTLNQLFENYYQDRLKLFPLEATEIGDNRYNNILPNDGSVIYLKQIHDFYSKYQSELHTFNPETLKKEDQISWSILDNILNMELEGEKFHEEMMPFAQFWSLPLTIGQYGSGKGSQPFKTVQDYENWLRRIDAFVVWTDTTIFNFRKGIRAGMVLPKSLVIKMIPQMENLAQRDSSKNVFYGPINHFPEQFSNEDKLRFTKAYNMAITTQLIPSFKKLSTFFSGEYLTAARNTSGINALPDGDARYHYYIFYNTTTRKTPDEIYQFGLNEVKRITSEMEILKSKIHFEGSLKELFNYMQTDKRFMPFKTKKEVLDSSMSVLRKIQPNLNRLFGLKPKTPFEIREIESFRESTASPEYSIGSADGTRPGIYYIPILDPTKINVTYWPTESTFLHEAIPGHHYQISLQQENNSLPLFRRFGWFNAFGEGWALYTESLGEQLGCYTNPYQKMGALGTEMHRAIRLVVDVSIHTGKMTREEAINYMREHEAISEQLATIEIERYMAMPGQALSYKIGEFKIKELRDKYQQELGAKFNLRDFHDAILKGGSMPLTVFEIYMNDWAKNQSNQKLISKYKMNVRDCPLVTQIYTDY